MDNNVGQNKSQVNFMFFAMLSLTWFPDGVILLFLLPGHSHMAPDRTTSWLRKSVKGHNLYLPNQYVERFNTIKSVEAEFIDHRSANRLMFRNFGAILEGHFVQIPPLPGGGYTNNYVFEFHKGILTIRKSPEAQIYYTHSYVQGKAGVDSQTYDDLANKCKQSLERRLFVRGKTFENATVDDINVLSTNGLVRHPGLSFADSKLASFWTKGFSIPKEHLDYYPVNSSEFSVIGFDEAAVEKKRKELDQDTLNKVKKYRQPVVTPSVKSSQSTSSAPDKRHTTLLSFFSKAPTNFTQNYKPKTTKRTLDWHTSAPGDSSADKGSMMEEQLSLQQRIGSEEKVDDDVENNLYKNSDEDKLRSNKGKILINPSNIFSITTV